MTEEEAKKVLLDSILSVKAETGWNDGQIADALSEITSTFNYYENLYVPNEALTDKIDEYRQWCAKWIHANDKKDKEAIRRLNQVAGTLMEELACLTFLCVSGLDSIKSYQSYAAQYDLIVSGSTQAWMMLTKLLHLPDTSRSIVIEAKNTQDAVSDAQFSRLCSKIVSQFAELCYLGIFFTREGASGFPKPDDSTRQRSLRDSRATQVIFHAKTGKFVVVLDDADIERLAVKGALPRILEAKIRDVEEVSGLSLEFTEDWVEVDLPKHLVQLVNDG